MAKQSSDSGALPAYYSDASVTVHHGDCLDVLRSLPDASVDAVVTDPPYGLGFMGKAWDDLPPGEEWARECLRVLKPGGHMLAFGGTRTWHRLAVAVEDAGFEVRDSIAWMYGSGFPKSLDVSKAIDKMDAAGERRRRNLAFTEWLRSTGVTSRQIDVATSSFMGGHYLTAREQAAVPTADMFDLIRPLIGTVPAWVEALVSERTVESENYKARQITGRSDSGRRQQSSWNPDGKASGVFRVNNDGFDVTAAHTDDARTWQGWGTALKPSFEPIVVARKSLAGTVAANVLAHGTGALNIDSCRAGDTRRWPSNAMLDESQSDGLGVEARYFYTPKADSDERVCVDGIAHPTVKPLDLMRWLVRLVTPPGGTILEPFAGSGTTVEACILEGFHCIAIEREADYLPLIVQRINRRRDPVAAVKATDADGGLFDLLDGGAA